MQSHFFFFSVFTTEGCNPENLTVQVSDIPCGGCVRPSRSPEQAALGGGVLTTTVGTRPRGARGLRRTWRCSPGVRRPKQRGTLGGASE